MGSKEIILTKEGYEKLEQEIHTLKVVTRKEVAQRIKEARAQGDLSENAEYDFAKDEQKDMEARILEIEHLLLNATIIDDAHIDKNVVALGRTVKLYDYDFDEEVTYYLVGSVEADISASKISNESPLGKALIGNKKGSDIEFMSPAGLIKYKILDVT